MKRFKCLPRFKKIFKRERLLNLAFHLAALLFFFAPGTILFLLGIAFSLGLSKDPLTPLTALIGVLLPVLSLANTALFNAVEDEKQKKRLAVSVPFIALSLPGLLVAGMSLASLLQGPRGWISVALGLILGVLYALLLIIPYFVSASRLIGILLDLTHRAGLFEDDTQATSKREEA